MYKKALFTFLTLGILTTSVLSFLAPNAKADEVGTWYAPTYQQWYTKVYDKSNQSEIYGERYTAAQVWWIIYSLRSFIETQISGTPSIGQCIYSAFSDCLPDLLKPVKTDASEGATLANTPHPSLMGILLADRPVSGITYTKNVLRDFHVVPEAYAQTGYGFGALTMVQNLWGSARDVAYALLILVIIVFAFMIMFRTKISPQAVITVQSALPKVIITLILVTFSFAIAGFMIDAMYVVMGLVALIFTNSGLAQSINWWNGNEPGDLFNFLINGPKNTGIFGMFVVYWTLFTATLSASVVLTGAFGSLLGTLLSPVLSAVTMPLGAVIELIVSIVLLVVTFKAMFTLLKTFVSIILLVIVAPIAILSGKFSDWIKNLAGNLAVYPATAVLFLISIIFLDQAYANTAAGIAGSSDFGKLMSNIISLGSGIKINPNPTVAAGSTWVPPLTFGTSGVVFMWLFASLATVALIPKVSEIVKGFITGKPFAYGTGIGQAFGPIAGVAGYGVGMGKAGAVGGIASGATNVLGALKTPGSFNWRTLGGEVASGAAGAMRKKSGV